MGPVNDRVNRANGTADDSSTLVIVIGSVREGRFGPAVAAWVAEQAGAHGGFDVVGLIDRHAGTAEREAKQRGIRRFQCCASLDAVPWLDEIDALVVATPPFAHYELVKSALERGKHLMPWRIEDELKKLGANFVQAGLWRGFAVRDGNLITGQQNFSGAETAHLIIEALGR